MSLSSEDFRAVVLDLEAHWHRDEPAPEVYVVYQRELEEFDVDEVRVAISSLARQGMTRLPLAGQIRQRIMHLRLDPPSWAYAIQQLRSGVRRLEEYQYPEKCLDGNEDCDGMGWSETEGTYMVLRRRWCECSKAEVERERKRGKRERGEPFDPCTLGVCDGSGLVEVEEPVTHSVAARCSCASKLGPDLGIHPTVYAFARLVGWDEIKRMLRGDGNAEARMRDKYEYHVKEEVEMLSLVGLQARSLARVARANDDPPALPRSGGSGMSTLGESVREALPVRTG